MEMEVKICDAILSENEIHENHVIVMNGELLKPIYCLPLPAMCGVKTEDLRQNHKSLRR
jgi:hypothetical protein